jgi:DNA mismatch repair protein MutS
LRTHSSPQAELPLFAPTITAAPVHAGAPLPQSAALEALRALDPNSLSPREALDLLFRLQQLDREDAL